MLLFISLVSMLIPGSETFKYISCYCLSEDGHFKLAWLVDSNTSHVIVYHAKVPGAAKYLIQIHLMLLFIYVKEKNFSKQAKFKYISCYCLSVPMLPFSCTYRYSNTSHVIVYLDRHNTWLLSVQHSNTSHVIVYHFRALPCVGVLFIQIHLMLLFISRNVWI